MKAVTLGNGYFGKGWLIIDNKIIKQYTFNIILYN